MTDTIPATVKTQHTALPWRFEVGVEDSEGEFYVCHSGTVCDATTVCNPPNEHDAAFIVRACNSHYQLVSALREAIEELWDRDHSSMDRIQFERANASLFTALSQAGGE